MASEANAATFLSCPICAFPLTFLNRKYQCQNRHEFPVNDKIICLTNHHPKKKLSLAQRSGAWKLTAFLYEKIWRPYSLSILTTGTLTTKDELMYLNEFVSGLNENSIVVDLTCSTGFYGRNISKHKPNLTILFCDYSTEMLKAGQKKNRSEKDFYISMWAEHRNFVQESVDAYVCGGSWNEIIETEKTIQEMYHSLKAGGRFFWMGILKSEKLTGKILQQMASWLGGLHFESPEEVELKFQTAGFKNIELRKWKSIFIITGKR